MSPTEIPIGKLSRRTGVKVETIRYYEKIGLMPPPPRKASGHRLYTAKLVDRLFFIRRGRELGFHLEDIRTMLGLEDEPPTCQQVFSLAQHHLAEIRSKIADLGRLERRLSQMAEQFQKTDTPDCAVIQALSASSGGADA